MGFIEQYQALRRKGFSRVKAFRVARELSKVKIIFDDTKSITLKTKAEKEAQKCRM